MTIIGYSLGAIVVSDVCDRLGGWNTTCITEGNPKRQPGTEGAGIFGVLPTFIPGFTFTGWRAAPPGGPGIVELCNLRDLYCSSVNPLKDPLTFIERAIGTYCQAQHAYPAPCAEPVLPSYPVPWDVPNPRDLDPLTRQVVPHAPIRVDAPYIPTRLGDFLPPVISDALPSVITDWIPPPVPDNVLPAVADVIVPAVAEAVPAVADVVLPSLGEVVPAVADVGPPLGEIVPANTDMDPPVVENISTSVTDVGPPVLENVPATVTDVGPPAVGEAVPAVADVIVPAVDDVPSAVADAGPPDVGEMLPPAVADVLPSAVTDFVPPALGDLLPGIPALP